MSGQPSQSTPARTPKTSPNSAKQGPMKATIPISSVLKQGSNLKSGHSPAVSPTYYWKNRTSPDHSSGQRSPGSSAYKGKPKTLGPCNSDGSLIRRTASLDTIYLKGRWPRDNFYWHTLQIDKATQTNESDWLDPRKNHSILETDGNREKLTIRQKVRGTKESNGKHTPSGDNTLNTSSQTLSSCILSPTFRANPMCIPMKPLPKSSIRSSVEGLNQEIERIVLKTGSESHSSKSEDYEKFYQTTPEGHRAPLAELLRSTRSRSVNTQTPQDFGSSSHSSGPPSRESISPLMRRRYMDSPFSETGDSQGSSPDQEASKLGSSPRINKFLAREPPDGCEKVHLKSLDERNYVPLEHAPQPCTFKLKPSLGSAFQILQPNTSNTVDQDLPLVPPQHELN